MLQRYLRDKICERPDLPPLRKRGSVRSADPFRSLNGRFESLFLCGWLRGPPFAWQETGKRHPRTTWLRSAGCTGHYYFRRGYDFVKAAEYVLDKKILSNGECYVSNVIQHMIGENKKFIPYVINQFYPIGTPEDLKKYVATHGKEKPV